jgi:hypothetical protein
MRPGAWSECGFLGETESLCEVVATDAATISDLGLTCPELAEPLGLLVRAPDACWVSPFLERSGLSEVLAEMEPSWRKDSKEDSEWLKAEIVRRFGTLEHADGQSALVGGRFEVELTQYCGFQECPWSREEEQSALVGDRFEVELTQDCGFHECPWGPEDREEPPVIWNCPSSAPRLWSDAASRDWRIRNSSRRLELSGSALLPHLIGEHGFFEGPASRYRLEPRAVAELLELGPFSRA